MTYQGKGPAVWATVQAMILAAGEQGSCGCLWHLLNRIAGLFSCHGAPIGTSGGAGSTLASPTFLRARRRKRE
jgi:hypothetical protein